MTQPRREFVLWMAIAIVALLAFAVILRLQYSNTQNRWAITVTPKPDQGSAVFREKGCANCHDGRAGARTVGAAAAATRRHPAAVGHGHVEPCAPYVRGHETGQASLSHAVL